MTVAAYERPDLRGFDPVNVALVGDIGGTNARFALVDLSKDASRLVESANLECRAFLTPGDAIAAYLKQTGLARTPAFAVIAAAGPVGEGAITLTNLNWTLSEADLRGRGFLSVRLINDYAAAALAAPLLDYQDAPSIGGPQATTDEGTVAVIGAGTGFGVSALARDSFAEAALATEGGHVGFAPVDEVEIEILRRLAARYGRVSIERLLSGAGLCNLHDILSDLAGEPAAVDDPMAITRAALAGDAACRRTLDRFCAILGSVAGDVTLNFGATGGIFIAGGIAPAILDYLEASAFRERFEAKGRFKAYLSAVPTRVIVRPHAALLGAADALRRLLKSSQLQRS